MFSVAILILRVKGKWYGDHEQGRSKVRTHRDRGGRLRHLSFICRRKLELHNDCPIADHNHQNVQNENRQKTTVSDDTVSVRVRVRN